MSKLKCVNCGTEIRMPMCCGQPMSNGGDKLYCHKGGMCMCGNANGKPIPTHCDQPMDVV